VLFIKADLTVIPDMSCTGRWSRLHWWWSRVAALMLRHSVIWTVIL